MVLIKDSTFSEKLGTGGLSGAGDPIWHLASWGSEVREGVKAVPQALERASGMEVLAWVWNSVSDQSETLLRTTLSAAGPSSTLLDPGGASASLHSDASLCLGGGVLFPD